tara:strand:- start:1837 stop:2055 length:219 start_codon:yes stop_codon:yes gene_type:complete
MTSDWCLIIQDRLWRAHDAADSEYKLLWINKIREYQRKQGVNYDEIRDGNGALLPGDRADIVLLHSKRRVKA